MNDTIDINAISDAEYEALAWPAVGSMWFDANSCCASTICIVMGRHEDCCDVGDGLEFMDIMSLNAIGVWQQLLDEGNANRGRFEHVTKGYFYGDMVQIHHTEDVALFTELIAQAIKIHEGAGSERCEGCEE